MAPKSEPRASIKHRARKAYAVALLATVAGVDWGCSDDDSSPSSGDKSSERGDAGKTSKPHSPAPTTKPTRGMDSGADASSSPEEVSGDAGSTLPTVSAPETVTSMPSDADAGGAPPTFEDDELDQLRALHYDADPPAQDASNAVADDPRARLLGQRLFFDPSLSGRLLEGDNDGSGGTLGKAGDVGRVSCSSCHVPESHFVDTRSPHHQISLAALWTHRRAPTLLDVAAMPLYNWDGRRDSIWSQAIGVMESEREFNSGRLFVAHQIVDHYRDEYTALFGDPPALDDPEQFPAMAPGDVGCVELTNAMGVTYECRGKPGDGAEYDGLAADKQEAVTRVMVNAAKSLEAYVRQLRCGASRFDQWLDGDDSAMTASEQRGAKLFIGRGHCADCHSGPNLSDGKFHNVGLRPGNVAVAFTDTDDHGAATGVEALLDDPLNTKGSFSDGARPELPQSVDPKMEGAFRTPMLRCISEQPSFMHTGQLTSLDSVVSFFSRGGDRPGGYPGTNELESLDLDDAQRADLVAFLGALNGPGPDESLLSPPSAPPVTTNDDHCGLDTPAFCDTFDAKPQSGGRAGELDPQKWSGARGMPQGHPDLDQAFPIVPALLPTCRDGLSDTLVYSDRDAVLCDPNPEINSSHLLIAAAAQNYGMTAYRIRQPFDFEDRVGTITLDVDLTGRALGGWPAIVLGEDPTPAPTFNYPERGSGPRNGLGVEFYIFNCNSADTIEPLVYTFENYVETTPEVDFDCNVPFVKTRPGALNRVQLRLGQGQLEVWAWDVPEPGASYGDPKLLKKMDLDLPFTRAYLSLVVRNHATIKYWYGTAWFARWDNIGFDGPVIDDSWEYSVPDPLAPLTSNDGCMYGGQCIWRAEVEQREPDNGDLCPTEEACDFEFETHTVGYVIPNTDEEPLTVTIPAVELKDATRARLVLAVDYPWFSWNDVFPPPTALNLRYRLNDGAWHDRFVTDDEVNAFAGDQDEGPGAGLLNQVIDLDLTELQAGDNALTLTLDGSWTGSYRAAATGIDLVLSH
jgi:cytochrome c peroxidase